MTAPVVEHPLEEPTLTEHRTRTARRWPTAGGAVALAAAALVAAPPTAAHAAATPVGTTAPATTVRCVGDGTTGPRVQVLYVYQDATAATDAYRNRFSEQETVIRQSLSETDWNVQDSAAVEGGTRYVRFLTQPCTDGTQTSVPITLVKIPASVDMSNYTAWVLYLKDTLGYNRTDRQYLMFAHLGGYCGLTHQWSDDESPGPTNTHNTMPGYATAATGCLAGDVATHELFHALGGVNDNAPHGVPGGHCLDDGWDIMCAVESGQTARCPVQHARLLDCGRDDYFAINPQGPYLPTHWNTADSRFLEAGPAQPVLTLVPPVPPVDLRLDALTTTSATVSFAHPRSAGSARSDRQGFEIYVNGVLKATAPDYTGSASRTTGIVLSGLSPDTTYQVTTRTRGINGSLSRVSTPLTVTTPPAPTATVKAQYVNGDTATMDSAIKPNLRVVNSGTSSVPLSSVTLRYWFTHDNGAATYSLNCDYAGMGCANVTRKVVTVSPARAGADRYLEVGFTASAGSVAAGATSGPIQLRINKTDWSAFDELNDHSRGGSTSFADWPYVTAYVNGVRVWGNEPA